MLISGLLNEWLALLQVKAVQEYLKEMLENTDQKLLVFAHHKELLDGVEFIMNKCAFDIYIALEVHQHGS